MYFELLFHKLIDSNRHKCVMISNIYVFVLIDGGVYVLNPTIMNGTYCSMNARGAPP